MINIDILASGSSGNCYLVSDGETTIALDCGISYKEIQSRSGFKKIDAAFVTHCHKDHSKAIPFLLKMGTEVYAPSNCFDYYDIRNHNAYCANPGQQILVKGVHVLPFRLEHDVECVGFVVDIGGSRIVYITDTMYCKYTFPGVTHFLIEANNARDILDENVANGTLNVSLRNRIVQSHMDIETVKNILRANDLSKVEAIYLLHLSNDNSDAERFRREVAEITGKVVIVA